MRGTLQRFNAMLVLFGVSKAGWFREVAALYSNRLRQVSLYTNTQYVSGYIRTVHVMDRNSAMCVCECTNPKSLVKSTRVMSSNNSAFSHGPLPRANQ